MNDLVRFLSRAVMWQAVSRLMRGRSIGLVVGLFGVAALAYLFTSR